jgi:hypothetical protein
MPVMRARVVFVVAFLAAWVLLGSAALALAHCATMAGPCEAPCGAGPTLVDTGRSGHASAPPTCLELLPTPGPSTLAPRGLDPVPRPLRLSA